jgi:hypothetical protein
MLKTSKVNVSVDIWQPIKVDSTTICSVAAFTSLEKSAADAMNMTAGQRKMYLCAQVEGQCTYKKKVPASRPEAG